jgi:type VI secretion system secreted protein Hcp
VAAVEYFLKVNGIKGGSIDAQHEDQIDVDGFSWGVTQLGGGAGGGSGRAGTGKPQLGELVVSTRTSIASPPLFLACASGQHFKDATLTARQAGGSEFLRIALTDVVVTSYQIGGAETDQPLDSVSFGFAKVEIEYRSMLPTGALGPAATAGWDVKSGKKL